MIELEQYQDIQIIQNTDFENTITFEAPHNTSNYDYKVVIAPDYASGATYTLTVGDGLTKTNATTLTMKLTDAQTDDFADEFLRYATFCSLHYKSYLNPFFPAEHKISRKIWKEKL